MCALCGCQNVACSARLCILFITMYINAPFPSNICDILLQVSIEDAQEADKMFSMLMGDDVVPRKDFIMTHAEDMSISDLDY